MGVKIGVTGTPTFLINQQIYTGALEEHELESIVAGQLAR